MYGATSSRPCAIRRQKGLSAQATAELAGLFGLPEGEEVLESFACALVQTYGCQHNELTPTREVRSRTSAFALVEDTPPPADTTRSCLCVRKDKAPVWTRARTTAM